MKMVPLGEVAEFASGGTPDRKNHSFYQGEIPWITGADIDDEGNVHTRHHITEQAVQKSATRITRENSLLLVTRTAVGKTLIPPHPVSFSQDLTAINPCNNLDLKYLSRFLQSRSQYFEQHARGATIKGVTRRVVEDLSIPLPPLDEQRRIAAILDKADVIRQKRRQATAHLGTLTQSLVARVLRSTTERTLLRDLIKDGPKNGLYRPKSAYGTGVPIIRIDSFKYGAPKLLMNSTKRLELKRDAIEEFALKEGDVLINRVNSRNYVGKTALVGALQEPVVFESNMMRLRLETQRVRERFFAEFMQTQDARRQLAPMVKDAINQSSINQQDVKMIEVPMPPIEVQDAFVCTIDDLESQRTALESSTRLADVLFTSLQSRAFRGEL